MLRKTKSTKSEEAETNDHQNTKEHKVNYEKLTPLGSKKRKFDKKEKELESKVFGGEGDFLKSLQTGNKSKVCVFFLLIYHYFIFFSNSPHVANFLQSEMEDFYDVFTVFFSFVYVLKKDKKKKNLISTPPPIF